MKQYKITIHSDDSICYVSANDEEDATEKYYNGEIDEWETSEWEQPDITVELEE